MQVSLTKIKGKRILLIILIFAFVLWVWNIGAVDLVSDDALYSFRALGWHDYLAADEQTGPIQWFGEIPWWANLSFHDAPPVVFAVQKIFFSVLGDNAAGARLPFVLSMLISLYFIFLIGKELHSRKAGYIACFLMSVMSLAVYGAVTGFLEGVEVLFIVLGIYCWVKFIKTDNNRYLYLLFIFLSLAIMSKYTAVFLPMAFILYLIFFRRDVFKRKELYLAGLIFVLILSPVIIYNLSMFESRGHFDAALASFFGQETNDFLTLGNREVNTNFFHSLRLIFVNLSQMMSLPVYLLFLTAVIYNIYRIFKKSDDRRRYFIFLVSFAGALAVLAVGGTGARFLIILIPFIVLLAGVLLAEAFLKINKKILFIFIILIFSWELAYNINSNFLARPITKNFLLYSQDNLALKKLGFNKLDKYLKREVLPDELELKRPQVLEDIDIRAIDFIEDKGIIYFFDDSMSWFAHNWYFRRYSNYYGLPLAPFSEQAKTLGVANPIKYFSDLGVKNYYYIYGVDESVIDPKKIDDETRASNTKLAAMLDKNGYEFKEIKNYLGQVAFRVYRFRVE